MSDYELNQLLNSSLNSSTSYTTSTSVGMSTWSIIALILSIIGAILVYFLFVKSKDTPKGKFLKWLKDFLSFKIMWIEPIFKVIYYFATIFAILISFSFLSQGGPGILACLCSIIIWPIIIRLLYELGMMFIMIWRNTENIAENTDKKQKKK